MVLTFRPERFAEAVGSLENHFLNLHEILNRMRPFQAKESLLCLLEEQVEQRRAADSLLKA